MTMRVEDPTLFGQLIQCPSCAHSFELEDAMQKEVERKLRAEYQQKFNQYKKDHAGKLKELDREKLELKSLQAKQWEIIQERLKQEKIRLGKKMSAEYADRSAIELEALKKRLSLKETENRDLKRKELTVLQKERALEEKILDLKLANQKALIKEQELLQRKLQQAFVEKEEMMRLEYEKRLDDQSKLLKEMQLKMVQGSSKMQGEIQEIAIAQFLSEKFTDDLVDSVKSGSRGADCLLTVRDKAQNICGTIYIESKRTKSFQNVWIEKLKTDMRHRKTDIGIIVTQAMPNGLERMDQLDGIWICSYTEFKGLIVAVRQTLMKVFEANRAQENTGEKMQMLYGFLTSNEFKMQVEAIVEGFTQMQLDLNKEKIAMQSLWKKREKQLEKVLLNTNYFYSSIKGIAGKSIGDIGALELASED